MVYALTLFWYTLGCRWKITVDVAASDYGDAITTQRNVGESIWRLMKSIFGMDCSGHLAGVYRQAFILNSYLFIPLGFLVYLWLLCGDSIVPASLVGRETRDVTTDGDSSCVNEVEATEESRTLANTVLKSILICVAISFLIEITQEISGLGMFDINDILANSLGGGVGVVLVISYVRYKQHQRLIRDLRGKKS